MLASLLCRAIIKLGVDVIPKNHGVVICRGAEFHAVATRWINRQQPQKDIVAKHSLNIAKHAQTVDSIVEIGMSGFLAKLNGGHGPDHEVDVESKKGGQQERHEPCQALSKENDERPQKRITAGLIDHFPHCAGHCPQDEVGGDSGVKNEQEEILEVLEANAIVDPRTVMVHLQDAHAADSAMMAAVWLVLVAPLAIAAVALTFPLLLLLQRSVQCCCIIVACASILWSELPNDLAFLRGTDVRNGPRMLQNAAQIAREEQGGDHVEDD